MSERSFHDLFDGSDCDLIPNPVATWNNGFNEAAAACGLSASDILDLDDGDLIADYCWMRNGGKVSVAVGNAIWTVAEADLTQPNAG